MSCGDLIVVGVGVLKIDDSRFLHNNNDELACFSVGNGDKNGSGIFGLEYALPFTHILVVCIGGRDGVIVASVNFFEAVKGMAKAGGVFDLCFDKAKEAAVLPMVVEALEEFDNGLLDAFNVGVS